jgi:hypothetical protein
MWMRRLGLDEWIKGTTINFATVEEMGEPLYGCVAWATPESKCEVSVARMEDIAGYSPDQPPELVLSKTIVHELLHLSLEGHRPHNRVDDDMYERALNRITEALVDAWEETQANNAKNKTGRRPRVQSPQRKARKPK